MSIQREYGRLVPTCDVCGEELEPYDDFEDAVAGKKLAGWKSVKVGGEWEDHCPNCQSTQPKPAKPFGLDW